MRAMFGIFAVVLALPVLVVVGIALGPVAGVLVLVSAFIAPLMLVGWLAAR